MNNYRMHLMLCAGTGCVSNGSFRLQSALKQELAKHDLQDEIDVVMTGCNGFCAQGPVMVVQPDGIFYQLLTEKNIYMFPMPSRAEDARMTDSLCFEKYISGSQSPKFLCSLRLISIVEGLNSATTTLLAKRLMAVRLISAILKSILSLNDSTYDRIFNVILN